jgi:hypothetical protein
MQGNDRKQDLPAYNQLESWPDNSEAPEFLRYRHALTTRNQEEKNEKS